MIFEVRQFVIESPYLSESSVKNFSNVHRTWYDGSPRDRIDKGCDFGAILREQTAHCLKSLSLHPVAQEVEGKKGLSFGPHIFQYFYQ